MDRGRALFFNETFAGNGRTCGTCHRAEDNFTLTPAFIATLPPDDPLFVAETNPALAANFENPRLIRAFGLILENMDGFEDLANIFVLRGIPHTLAQGTSVESRTGPRTGWSGDGAPGDLSLRSFATGAVIQHFTRTLNRVPGVDFRLPTDQELDDLEAFMRSLGRQQDLALPLPVRSVVAARGQAIFLDNTLGKCNACHFNAGANANPAVFGAGAGNLSFNTGVENLPDKPADLTGERVPPDDGFGVPGNGEFNTPPLVEAADTPPFFHNSGAATLEAAVEFYTTNMFGNSAAGLAGPGAFNFTDDQIEQVAAFLRAINAMDNARNALAVANDARRMRDDEDAVEILRAVESDIQDGIDVLNESDLAEDAVAEFEAALELAEEAIEATNPGRRNSTISALQRTLRGIPELIAVENVAVAGP